ncbi:MAG: MBL fold metallo-hydrolase [Flavobacteriales bacterium]|nr:MBL fold metallo-hydrolase [Flavobacteriales bacterium]|tara:strand:+ start:462 stop:1235 length:774 start_codon:yes stop_codon:yes gene_type:complete
MASVKVTFLGTGTSQGVPVIGCDCMVCYSANPRDNRLRSSILIETQNKVFCVDTGPDFRQQMLREKVQRLDAVLYTHEHKDHTAGMDDVRAFNFKLNRPIDLYVDENVDNCLRREFSYAFSENPYPGVPRLQMYKITNEPFSVQGVDFIPIQLMHHKLPVFGFRIGDFAYCTDVNYIAPEEKQKLKGLEVLILTALRKEKHISHFSLSEALELIDELKPKKAYLTHISHYLGMHSEVSKELPKNVALGYDGLSFSVG